MDATTKKFSRVLRRLRTERNLTQEALAQRAGVDYKYLQKLEGRTPSSPTLSTLEKLAQGLNIQLVDLIRSVQEYEQRDDAARSGKKGGN